MNENLKTNDCERGVELVAYFYGEASAAERESFAAHLARCGACREELTAFRGVREAVGHWRAEILSSAPALSFAETVMPTSSSAQEVRRERVAPPQRSARLALREFFTLSPVWLRAGLSAAALVLCALAALAIFNAEVRWDEGGVAFVTRLRGETQTAPNAPEVAVPAGKLYTQADVDNLIAERDAALLRELEDTRAQLDDSRAANLIAAVETVEPASASSSLSTTNNTRRARRAAAASPAPNARQRRFGDDRDEEDVPRLYDLLREAN
ncbi:MAG TPA: zf-HC2 domain-containing protein [Pyrinomonadaceae bacterium]|nr:zf-HC2 domain-containing protein [Pyrinomonadaceae bacterium]